MAPKAKKDFTPADHRDLDSKLLDESYQRVRTNLRNVLHATVFCGICLDRDQSMYEMNFEDSRKTGGSFTPERMMQDVLGTKMIQDLPSVYICNKCRENVRQNYMFMCSVKNSCKIVNNYIEQMNNQMQDVESYVLTSEDFSNTVIVLQDLVKIETNITTIDKVNSKKYSCAHCGKKLQSRSAIAYHIRNVHSTTRKKCPECNKRPCLHEKYLIAATEQKAQGLKTIKCPDCEYETREIHVFITHVNKNHLDLKPHLCESCGQSFYSRSSRLMHNCPSQECTYCEQSFHRTEDRQRHEEMCETISRIFKCDWCSASFDKKKLISRHIRRKHTQIKCSKCHINCISINTLRTHELYAHSARVEPVSKPRPSRRVMECILCPKKFMNRKDLRDHQLKHHGPNDRYKCKLCRKEFLSRKLYLQHCNTGAHISRLNPNAEFSFKCEHCAFSATSSKVLENHVNLVHLKIKPYICVTCSKAFTTESHLRNHLDTHQGIRRYQCPHCAMMLCSMSGLKRHLFRRHSSSRPFPCGECEVQCVTKGELALHYTRKHGGPKSEPCPLCDGKYSLMSHVRGHIRKVHAKGRSLKDFLDEEGQHCPELLEIFRDRRVPVMEP